MRVIAGKYRGHLLAVSRRVKIRPTSQKVKAAIFNILGEKINGACFLELFAGSGSIGIEAKSRGAAKVIFVENNRLCIKAIEKNLTQLKIEYNYGLNSPQTQQEKGVTVLPLDAERAIELLSRNKQKFDFVFLDPPYQGAQLKNCLIKIGHYDILNPHSLVIAEHYKSTVLPQQLAQLNLMLIKRYGDAALSFYRVVA